MDGAGKVDGSVVVALPMEAEHPFQGGGLTFWDGKTVDPDTGKSKPLETHYDSRSGDVAFIDRYVCCYFMKYNLHSSVVFCVCVCVLCTSCVGEYGILKISFLFIAVLYGTKQIRLRKEPVGLLLSFTR